MTERRLTLGRFHIFCIDNKLLVEIMTIKMKLEKKLTVHAPPAQVQANER